MNRLYGFSFVLEEFAQNISHVSRKMYMTHDFFTDRQVYAALTGLREMQPKWEYKRVPNTLALPLHPPVKKRQYFSTLNRQLEKSNELVGKSFYLIDGHQEYLAPGNIFVAFSLQPPPGVLFIGKKGCLARVETVAELSFRLVKDAWTTEELIYLEDYRESSGKEITEINLRDASQRFLFGKFKCREILQVDFLGRTFGFYNLVRLLKECR